MEICVGSDLGDGGNAGFDLGEVKLGREAGTYALLLKPTSYQTIQIGRLRPLHIQPGYYVYVGSAFGAGGVAARVGRHLRKEKRLHWHIDYLRLVTEIEKICWCCDDIRHECEWATLLCQVPGAKIPLRGFGASDCKCESHLVWMKEMLELDRVILSDKIRNVLPGLHLEFFRVCS